jgi:two-component system, LytTR family, response regulator
MTTITAAIVDDEPDGRESLTIALAKYFPEVSVIGIHENATSALEAIKRKPPELLFLDIQMPFMSGFELLRQLTPISFEVIFVTAHDQYAIKAIRFSALDYLLKPLDLDDLRNAIQKAKERLHSRRTEFQYRSVIANAEHRNGRIERIAIPAQEGIEFFNTADIIFLQAEGSYTKLFLTHHRTYLASRNLKDFENLLTGSGFMRVHHGSLINLAHIHKYIKGDGGYVILTDDHHVDVSRRKKEDFLRYLDSV